MASDVRWQAGALSMFNWGKKDDGFSWEKHIRTTVLYRRAKRREKVVQARDLAADGVKKAGDAGLKVGRESAQLAKRGVHQAAQSVGAASVGLWAKTKSNAAIIGQKLWSSTKSGSRAAWYFALKAADEILPILGRRLKQFWRFLAPVLDKIQGHAILQPTIAVPAGVIGLLAAVAAAVHISESGIGGDAFVATALAVPLLGLAFLSLLHKQNIEIPLPAVLQSPTSTRIAGFAVLGGLVAAVGWVGYQQLPTIGFQADSLISSSPSVFVKGRAVAMSGDTMRIAGRVVKLDGIDAPIATQRCKTARSKSWRCGRAALRALRKLTGRLTATCERVATHDDGTPTVTCTNARYGDLGKALVTRGHVFATETFMNAYRENENEAREAKRGIWQGRAQRPDKVRAAKWAAAKKARPDGCPIKGRVSRSGRKYVLPWSESYRRIKVRNSLGERWFCSEDEALAAGWQPSGRS